MVQNQRKGAAGRTEPRPTSSLPPESVCFCLDAPRHLRYRRAGNIEGFRDLAGRETETIRRHEDARFIYDDKIPAHSADLRRGSRAVDRGRISANCSDTSRRPRHSFQTLASMDSSPHPRFGPFVLRIVLCPISDEGFASTRRSPLSFSRPYVYANNGRNLAVAARSFSLTDTNRFLKEIDILPVAIIGVFRNPRLTRPGHQRNNQAECSREASVHLAEILAL